MLPQAIQQKVFSLYVGNVSSELDDKTLRDLFSQFGNVASTKIIKDQDKNGPGRAYVNFLNREEAEAAKENLNYTVQKGRVIKISWQEKDPAATMNAAGNIMIKGLPDNLELRSLYKLLSQFGEIISMDLKTNKTMKNAEGNMVPMNVGYCSFREPAVAEQVIKVLNGKLIEGAKVTIEMIKKEAALFVKPLPADETVESLKELFGKFGKVQNATISLHQTGESKGFGFVEFGSLEEANAAEKGLNGTEYKGQTLTVSKPTPRNPRDKPKQYNKSGPSAPATAGAASMYPGGMSSSMPAKASSNLYIKNLAENIDDNYLREKFSAFGEVTNCTVMRDAASGVSRGFGFCSFKKAEEAANAMAKMHGSMLEGKRLYVNYFQPRAERQVANEKQRQMMGLPIYMSGPSIPAMYPAMNYPAAMPQPQQFAPQPYNPYAMYVPAYQGYPAPMNYPAPQQMPPQNQQQPNNGAEK